MSPMSNHPLKKWLVLGAGVVLQAVLGGIYAWSAFVPPLYEQAGLSKGQCGSIFGLAIATFAIAMIPAGKFLQRFGPRLTAAIGSILFGVGYLLASYSNGSFVGLLLSYGLVVGVGIGFGYVCPLTTGMKWFPDNKGLVTGVAVAGFGGGAIILSSVAEHLLYHSHFSIFEVFRFTGVVFGILALIASLFISEPERSAGAVETDGSISLKPNLMTGTFALSFLGMFAGTFAGLLIIGNLKPMMLDFGLNEFYATLTISLFAIGNIFGRIFWGQIHDRLGSRNTILISLGFFFVTMLALHVREAESALILATPLIGAGFGGCFVVYASTIVEKFGVKLFARMYPICFLGYGLAALTGPSIGGWLADRSGSFSDGINLSLATILLTIIVIFFSFDRGIDENVDNHDSDLIIDSE